MFLVQSMALMKIPYLLHHLLMHLFMCITLRRSHSEVLHLFLKQLQLHINKSFFLSRISKNKESNAETETAADFFLNQLRIIAYKF